MKSNTEYSQFSKSLSKILRIHVLDFEEILGNVGNELQAKNIIESYITSFYPQLLKYEFASGLADFLFPPNPGCSSLEARIDEYLTVLHPDLIGENTSASGATKRCVAFPYCGDCKCGSPVSPPNTNDKIARDAEEDLKIGAFFDYLTKDYYRKGMLKYINMAALRDDFITAITKTIHAAKNKSNFNSRTDFIYSAEFFIPFDFARVTDGDISGRIRDFVSEMVSQDCCNE